MYLYIKAIHKNGLNFFDYTIKKSPALAVSFLIFKDLLLKTGGCLPKYLWASHYIL